MKFPRFEGKLLILLITAPVVIIADQVTKALAKAYLKPLLWESSADNRFVTVIDNFFKLKYVENPGSAWGLFQNTSPSFRLPFLITVTVLAIGLIVWFFYKIEPHKRFLPLAVSLVLGGAVGNLIDRIFAGRVVDFIDWYLVFEKPMDLLLFDITAGEKHWPTFNIADVGITVGIVFLFIDMIIEGRQKAAQQQEERDRAEELG